MVKLRPYQQAAVKAGMECLSLPKDRFIINLPTGAGKNVVGTYLAHELRHAVQSQGSTGTVLWLAGRETLLDQAEETLRRCFGNRYMRTQWRANKKNAAGEFVYAMIGSTRKLEGNFDIVVVDEAHHFYEGDEDYNNMYQKLLERITWRYLVGLTATATRLDRKQLYFDRIRYSVPFFDLVKKRRLASPVYLEMKTGQYFDLQSRQGEFTNTSLQKLADPERDRKIAADWVGKRDFYGKTILFAASVKGCYSLLEEIKRQYPEADAGVIHGAMMDHEKEAVKKWFATGDHKSQKILINCMVFTEGYDEPSINTVIIARPTKSKSLWMQMVGRGSRIVMASVVIPTAEIQGYGPAGDDGVLEFKHISGTTFLGEIVTQEPGVMVLDVQTCNSFNIVNVMDDIEQYGNLVEEWILDLKDPTEAELQGIKIKKEIQAVEETVEQAKKEAGGFDDKYFEAIGPARFRDIIGILVYSNKYARKVGVPLDVDRFNCLWRILDYAEQCNSATGGFDYDHYADAYSSCVLKGEFPYGLFEDIRWAFYHKFVEKRDRVEYARDGKMYDTWNVIPLKEITAESRQAYIAKAKVEMEEAQRANAEFNQRFKSRQSQQRLLSEVFQHALDNAEEKAPISRGIGLLKKHVVKYEVADRRIKMMYRKMGNFKIVTILNKTAALLTTAFQSVLDDPTALVTTSPIKG